MHGISACHVVSQGIRLRRGELVSRRRTMKRVIVGLDDDHLLLILQLMPMMSCHMMYLTCAKHLAWQSRVP